MTLNVGNIIEGRTHTSNPNLAAAPQWDLVWGLDSVGQLNAALDRAAFASRSAIFYSLQATAPEACEQRLPASQHLTCVLSHRQQPLQTGFSGRSGNSQRTDQFCSFILHRLDLV